MFAYDDLVQWCKDMRSAQIARRNRAWNFQHAHGIDPCDVAWNADAIRWVDGMVYVVSRNVKRNGELDEEADERVCEEENSIITVGRFKFDSLLAKGLAEWFECKRYELTGYVRSCWLSRGGDDWYFYFVTGCGYDVLSSDLLGCECDGVARDKFVDFLNGGERK